MQLDQQTLAALLDAAKKLDAGFANLPAIRRRKLPGADRISRNPQRHRRRASTTTTPTSTRSTPAKCSSPRIRSRASPTRWQCSSIPTITRSTAAAPPAPWKKKPSPKSPRCSAGKISSAISPAAAPWPISKPSGSPASSHPGKKILASEQAHYTHHRISSVLKLEFESIPVDTHARMDLNALEKRLAAKNDVGTVVVTMGTTATGSVDPLPEILDPPRSLQFPHPRRRRLRRLLHARAKSSAPRRRRLRKNHRSRLHRHRPAQTRPATLRLRLRPLPRSRLSAASTNTIRPTPTSAPPNSTSAKSASNARAPAPPPPRSGPLKNYCHSSKAANSHKAWNRAGKPP